MHPCNTSSKCQPKIITACNERSSSQMASPIGLKHDSADRPSSFATMVDGLFQSSKPIKGCMRSSKTARVSAVIVSLFDPRVTACITLLLLLAAGLLVVCCAPLPSFHDAPRRDAINVSISEPTKRSNSSALVRVRSIDNLLTSCVCAVNLVVGTFLLLQA